MRRAVARGRIVPQSLSTDPRMGRLSLKAALLFPLMWINCDDQGRLSGDPDEIKYTTCPNIDHITKTDIPELLKELEKQEFMKVYPTSKTKAIQMLDWWDVQRLQWAWPSDYPPPEGWQDRLRFKKGRKEVITENWGDSGENSGDNSGDIEHSGEKLKSPRDLPSPEKETEEEKRKEKRKRKIPENSPEFSGEKPSPSPRAPPSEIEILHRLTECFKREWGRVKAEDLDKIIPREPTAKESAQLRDLARELSSAGGCPLETIDEAFRDVAGQPQPKMHVSYVRKVLRTWLGLERGPPG